jgi:hypothetical protein
MREKRAEGQPVARSSGLDTEKRSGSVSTSPPGDASTKNKHLAATNTVAVCMHFMNDILNKAMVLVLNRNWQAVNVRTPQEAFCMMATNVATGLEIEGENHIRPVAWDEWITLPMRPQDNAVRTVRGPIRVPTVIVAVNYA